jgi:type IV pilus assembly protein PilA
MKKLFKISQFLDLTKRKNAGFTLIEILVVIGIIALLATIVIVAINPARQFAQARNTQRTSHINSLLNAVGQNIADNKGNFACATAIPTTVATMTKAVGGYDIRPCILSTYIPEVPFDPSFGNNTCSSDTACATGSYDTGYTIQRDSVNSRVTICAPYSVEAGVLNASSTCVTR